MRLCTRCVMDDASDNKINFKEDGTCNYCNEALNRMHNEYFPNDEGKIKLEGIMARIKNRSKGSQYDCMVGVSGGVDSSYVILLGYQYGLRVLAVHINDGLDTEIATHNINAICKATGADLITVSPQDLNQYKDLIRAFFLARLPNLAMPQDNIIASASNDAAKKYRVKFNLSGGNFALESILERSTGINALDTKHIRAIHSQFGRGSIGKLRLATFFEEYIYGKYFNKTTKILPLNFIDYNLKRIIKELSDFCGFIYYGGKHHESILTRFLQCYYLPVKYQLDKRKSHFSSMIMSGQMTREEALQELAKDPYPKDLREHDFDFLAEYLRMSRKQFEDILALPAKKHLDYPISFINKLAGPARKYRKYLGTSG